jgi:tRNA nucleotidyltransferase (CCA-adding enzyme)
LRTVLSWTCRLHTHANRWSELRDSTKVRIAEQASRAGIGAILPLVSAADKPDGTGMGGWAEALVAAGMGAEELGVAPDRLGAMAPEERSRFLLDRRIAAYRAMTGHFSRLSSR